jgi:uncharacterized protein
MKTQVKRFHYDELLEAEDICNLSQELEQIEKGIKKNEKMIIYGRRNSGKTSLIKNVVIRNFKTKHPKSFVFFADLMQVKDEVFLASRLRVSLQESFRQSFPKQALLTNITKYFQGLRPVIQIDPLTGEPSFTIENSSVSPILNLTEILNLVHKKILKDIPGLVVFDEFQDISFIPGAEGIFRNALQEYKNIPVILMGSKKHLLSRMFAKPQAPFADFGVDISFNDIAYEEFYVYIKERFEDSRLKLSLETSVLWQDLLFRNPEAVNSVGAYLVDHYKDMEITIEEIRSAIDRVMQLRAPRFEEMLSQFSSNEQDILSAVAKYGPIMEPSSKSFLRLVKPSHGTVTKIMRDLMDQSILERNKSGYQLTNPLLKFYLLRYR